MKRPDIEAIQKKAEASPPWIWTNDWVLVLIAWIHHLEARLKKEEQSGNS